MSLSSLVLKEHVMSLYRSLPRPGLDFPLVELRDELDRLWTSLTAAEDRGSACLIGVLTMVSNVFPREQKRG